MNAFLIVDPQNDFCPGGTLAVPEGDQIIPLINKLQHLFSLIVATQDWHPKDHLSFASQHHKKAGEEIMLKGLKQILWPDHCVQGTPGAELVSGLNRERIAAVFRKGTDRSIDSYSGFFDNGHQKATGLGDYLKGMGVKSIYVAGLTTDYCVKYTALDGVLLGFETYVIDDATRGVGLKPGDVQKAILEMKKGGIKIVKSDNI